MSRLHARVLSALGLLLVATLLLACSSVGPLIPGEGAQSGKPIVRENARPGNPPGEWDIAGAGDPSIQGFTTDISVDQGETVSFKVDTDASAYRLDIYRMGYYRGMGARKMATIRPSATLPQAQPPCLTDATTGVVDCGNWSGSASWRVPPTATSGIYFAKLVRMDRVAGASHIVFVVRDDDGGSDLLFQTSDTTWQAYNAYGGNSLYIGAPAGRAYKVSYNRPFSTRGQPADTATGPSNWVFYAEYPMVRWLEANGYDVSYSAGVDSERRGAEILEHKAFLSVGHDEYWSAGQRAHVEAARAAGVHLAFFSGNDVFWKTRWEDSIDGSGTPHRTLVCYKETEADRKLDPSPLWTGMWRDGRFSRPGDGGRPENALTGTIYTMLRGTTAIEVPAELGGLRFWRHTDVAALPSGDTATLAPATLGYEWNEDLDNGARPAGLIRLSSTTLTVSQSWRLVGYNYGPGTAIHSLTLYRHPSGALVFAAGTVQWTWGLDPRHDVGPDVGAAAPDVRMQQATVNLFADMGIQPATLQPRLTAATATADAQAPTTTITSPPVGSTVEAGRAIEISGEAADAGGGTVGGVEVSVDGGATWHPAAGRERWTFRWTPRASGSGTIRSRAVDDSGNLEQPSAGINVAVTTQRACPCGLWDDATTPWLWTERDSTPIELGVRFRSDVDGYVTALRLYKDYVDDEAHVGHLWAGDGELLGSATFPPARARGWQRIDLATPVPIRAGETYIASYYSASGTFAITREYFSDAGVGAGPLRAPRDGEDGRNGVYHYRGSGFPTSSFEGSNYWVDVVFTPRLGAGVGSTDLGNVPVARAPTPSLTP